MSIRVGNIKLFTFTDIASNKLFNNDVNVTDKLIKFTVWNVSHSYDF